MFFLVGCQAAKHISAPLTDGPFSHLVVKPVAVALNLHRTTQNAQWAVPIHFVASLCGQVVLSAVSHY
jgi:hypothetical protein